MAEDIRHRQNHIGFLEDYITEITEKIDELTGGRDIVKRIDSLEYRIDVLGKAGTNFQARIGQLQKELKTLRDEYEKIKPMIEELEAERAYYRRLQSEL